MTRNLLALALVAAVVPSIVAPSVAAQGAVADYQRSDRLRTSINGLTRDVPDPAVWIGSSTQFWYRKSVPGGYGFVTVDAPTGRKEASFDHARLATAISTAGGRRYTPVTLPFTTLTFTSGGGMRAIEFAADSSVWRCSLDAYACTRSPMPVSAGAVGGGARVADSLPRRSPDGRMEAVIRDFNLFVRSVDSREYLSLSTDGSEGNAYQRSTIRWSPDSKKLVAYRVKPGFRRMVRYVESSPEDQVQPKYSERLYLKPGDALEVEQPVLFHVESRKQFVIDHALFPNAYAMSDPVWWSDSRGFRFDYNQRGHQLFRVVDVNAETGIPRVMVEEAPKTFFNYSGKMFASYLHDGKETIWMSERDGWNHLYLYDGSTGRVKNQITKGNWVVKRVVRVDEKKRQLWFAANGMRAGEDPYLVHFYRINFDGTGLVPLTTAHGNHTVAFAADSNWYVDTWSRVDTAPQSELRRVDDPKYALVLERGDVSALAATGWRAPQPYVAQGRDGTTDIWGVVLKPSNFDSTKRYPVIEYIYAGPQDSFVPKSFSAFNNMQALAELGFIVVQIDGMGTSNRSKAFHDVAWKNLGDAGFPDRILWHRAYAAKHPWYDTSRVGIYGTSAGGQNSLGGLLFHPDFYKAAVSAAGCHDNRMDKIWWNEQWMGWPIADHYARSSNVDNARLLQGKLLLVVGEQDTNVDPSSTMQVVNALIKSNKMFDLLYVPGMGHSDGGAYGQRKRNDFFVHHLMGVEPPDRNALAEPPRRASGG